MKTFFLGVNLENVITVLGCKSVEVEISLSIL